MYGPTHPTRIDKRADLMQTVILGIEICNSVELWGMHKTATSIVRPAVITTAQHAAAADGLRGDGVGPVAANVVEGAQVAVAAADEKEGEIGDVLLGRG